LKVNLKFLLLGALVGLEDLEGTAGAVAPACAGV
jgi:hypothetical protein